jgi:hypothetical protein
MDPTHQFPRDDERPDEYRSTDYIDLPKDQPGAMRILKLRPATSDTSQIDCSLIIPEMDPEGNLITPESYDALSWSWGTSEKTKYIRITQGDGHNEKTYAKSVTPTLYSALRSLRDHKRTRFLWIDAICINQENFDERNHQVEQMDRIYGNAKRVCIWLGDSSKSSKIAIDFIKDEVMKLQNFDELCDRSEASSKWLALLELMQREWFSRRWVVQEIALARSAIIYCGNDKISWNKFAIAVELFVEVETATHRLSEVMKGDVKSQYVPGWFEYVADLGASLLVDATGKLFPDYRVEDLGEDEFSSNVLEEIQSRDINRGEHREGEGQAPGASQLKQNGQKTKQTPLLSLEYLVSNLSLFDTSVPHDTVYALLAISKDTTPTAAAIGTEHSSSLRHAQDVLEIFTQRKRYKVDYKLPYVDVCKDFIHFCINRSLQIDKSRALDVICRPWATDQKRLDTRQREIEVKKQRERDEAERRRQQIALERGRRDSKEVQEPPEDISFEDHHSVDLEDMPLPSWAPQLSNAPYAMFSQPGIPGPKMSRTNADPLVGLPSAMQKNYAAAETKSVDMKVLKFRKRYSLDHFSLYVRGFVLDTIERVSELCRNGQIPEDWAEIGNWHQVMEREPPDAFWRTLVANRGKDGKNPPVYYARACKESFMKGGYRGGAVNTSALISYERNSVVAEFCRRVQAVTWNRAIVKTKSGKLGLVGKNVQVGDLVCVLYGCSVPVILRKGERKTEETFEEEMKWELGFLNDTLTSYFRRWQKRVEGHRLRKEESKRKFYEWEVEKCTEWLEDKFSDTAELKQWRTKLNEEVKAAKKLDREIENVRKALHASEDDYKKLKTAIARKTAENKWIKQKWNEDRKIPSTQETQTRTEEAAKKAKKAQEDFHTADANFKKKLKGAAWFSQISKECDLHKLAQDKYDALQKIVGPLDGDTKKANSKMEFDAALKQYTEFVRTLWKQLQPNLDEAKSVLELEKSMKCAQEEYEQTMAGIKFEDADKINKKLQEIRINRRLYEKKRKDRRYYFRFLHPEHSRGPRDTKGNWWRDRATFNPESCLRDSINSSADDKQQYWLEFQEFKIAQVKIEILRVKDEQKKAKEKGERKAREKVERKEKEVTEKAFPDVDWQEFELWLKYGKKWLKSVKRTQERIKKKLEKELSSGKQSILNKNSNCRRPSDSKDNGFPERKAGPLPDLCDGDTAVRSKDRPDKPPLKPKPSPEILIESLKALKSSEEGQLTVPTAKVNEATMMYVKDSAEHIPPSGQVEEHKEFEAAADNVPSNLFYDDSDDTDWEDAEWISETRQLYESLGELKRKQEDLKPKDVKQWKNADWETYSKEYDELENSKETERDEWKDKNWSLYRRRDKAKKKKDIDERMGEIHVEDGRVRRRLTREAAAKYDKKIKRNLRKKLGQDGFWSYTFLGESYIHGMMDGEAMAYLNGKDQEEAIMTSVFELR